MSTMPFAARKKEVDLVYHAEGHIKGHVGCRERTYTSPTRRELETDALLQSV
jgi:hypothetical protein